MTKKKKASKPKKRKISQKRIEEIRSTGILINDDGEFCRQVPECCCGMCRYPDPYGGCKP